MFRISFLPFIVLLTLALFFTSSVSAQPAISGYTYMGDFGGHLYYLSDGVTTWGTALNNCNISRRLPSKHQFGRRKRFYRVAREWRQRLDWNVLYHFLAMAVG